MPPLSAVERFFERLLERPSARLFRTRLQPVQLQRRIERAMEAERLAATDRTLVPNRFLVRLNPEDLAGFGEMQGSLATELADGALIFARAHHYTLVDRPRVDLLADPSVERSDIAVDARFADPIAGRRPGGDEPLDGESPDEDPMSTRVFTVPRPVAPAARLIVNGPGNHDRVVSIPGGTLRVGRAPDNDLVLGDGRVSRHHGRIAGRQGTLVYTDLGSTNGSRVNGEPVIEVVLRTGDRILVGDTTLEVRLDEPAR
jgi:FOG: FHA domain